MSKSKSKPDDSDSDVVCLEDSDDSSKYEDALSVLTTESAPDTKTNTTLTTTTTTACANSPGPGPEEPEPVQGTSASMSKKKRRKRNRKKPFNKPKQHVKQDQEGSGSEDPNFSYTCNAQEDHGQVIYGCQFHQNLGDDQPLIFATCGSNRVTIYECTKEGSIKLLQCFEDADAQEIFYTVAWSDDASNKPILAAAGFRGIIRIFSPEKGDCIKYYVGHGHSVNDLTFHPQDRHLLVSASKDHSLRLWNLKTQVCIAIFGGFDGHRDEVLSADIDLTGSRMVSTGMDHSLKIWKLKKPEIEKAIRLSHRFNPKSKGSFTTLKVHIPDWFTREIHKNYVDCVRWFGDFIFSKSCEDEIVCWKTGKMFQEWDQVPFTTSEEETEISEISRLDVPNCDIWFIRFCLDFEKETLACGNQIGKVFLYDLTADDPGEIPMTTLAHPECNALIRQTSFSRDGKVLICVCDDSTIWRWDVKE